MKKRLLGILLTMCLIFTMLPTVVMAAEGTVIDGWYNLRCMNNYLNFTADSKAELRKLSENEAFYVQHVTDYLITLQMKDGKYLGLNGEQKNGTRVVAVNTPYTWAINWEKKSEIFSLRPPENITMVLNASEQKNADGTHIIIWTSGGTNAPENAEFRFIPVSPINDPTGESFKTFKENKLVGYKDFKGNVVIPAQFDRAMDFSQGVALVSRPENSEYAFINTAGAPITPYKYSSAGTGKTVHDGLILVAAYSDAVTKALQAGDNINRTEYNAYKGTDLMYMESGKTFTGKDKEIKFGYINTKGQEVIKPQFDRANDFKSGMAAVYQYQGFVDEAAYYKVGWIDTSGKLVIPYKSEDYIWYSANVYDFEDDFARYFKHSDSGFNFMPSGGIMDKTGKVIIPAENNTFIDNIDLGLQWKDGVIAVTPWYKVNSKGQRDANGKYRWPQMSLYDYTGRLIATPKGYFNGYPLGGGYTLSMYKVPADNSVEFAQTTEFEVYWSVFDRNGNKVVDRAEENNLNMLIAPYGYENGYVYFGNSRYKV